MKIKYGLLREYIKTAVKVQLNEDSQLSVPSVFNNIVNSIKKFTGKYQIKPVLNTPDNKSFDIVLSDESHPSVFKDIVDTIKEIISHLGFQKYGLDGTYSGTFIQDSLEVEINKQKSNTLYVQIFDRKPLI